MRKNIRARATFIALILLGVLLTRATAFELSVSPPRLMLLVEPGRAAEAMIRLSGSFDRPTRIRATIGDWGLEPNGVTYFEPTGRNERSLARWMTITPSEFVLSTGRVQAVRLRLQAPEDIAGGYWGVVFFQNLPEATPPGRGMAAITTIGRITTTVYAETKQGAVKQGKVTSVEARWNPPGALAMSAAFQNTGNTLLILQGRFEIREINSGKTLARVSLAPDLRVLPGAKREVTAMWLGKLPPGNYVVLALIDYGSRSMVAGQCSFRVE